MADVLELQYAVLGSMLTRPECVGEAVSLLTAEDFDTLATRGLFEAISRLHFAGAPVDPVTVLREAGEDYAAAIQEVSGRSASDVPYYCGLLREEMQLRKVQSCAYDLVSAETLEAAGEVVDLLNSLFSLRRKVDVVHARDAALDFIQRLSRQERPEYISLGVDWLDSRLFLELGDLVLLGGNASSGKTLLSLQFARKLAERYRVGYFSLETGSKKLTDRLISHMGQISFNHIKDMELSEEEAKRAVSAARRLDRLFLDFVPSSNMSVQDIQAVTLSRRYQVIFVDYLQIVQSKGQTRYEQVTNISIALHTLAQSHGVLVIALAQLGRPEKVDGKAIPPSMSSFRESGQLEQDADVALLLWPSDMRDNSSSRMLKIGKNKDGERGTLELAFDGAMQTMSPLPEEETGVDVAAYYAAVGRKAKRRSAGRQIGFQDLPDDNSPPPF